MAEFLAARGVPGWEFRRALCASTDVLYSSMYGAADEPGSLRFVTELAELVEPLGVGFPALGPFAGSQWSDGPGWGTIPTTAELRGWREGDLAEPGTATDRGPSGVS